MSTQYFIALDTHCEFCEMVAMTGTGRIVKRDRLPTNIPALVEALEQVRHPRYLTFEEGALADWLARSLRPYADQLLVCEPRRNALIAKEGEKDDPIDTEKLAHLFRGGFLKEVHQVESLDRAVLKQHVGFYHDWVRDRVRQGHRLTCLLRRHGVFTSIARLMDPLEREYLWKKLPRRKILRTDLDRFWNRYEQTLLEEDEVRSDLIRLARREEPVRRFQELPGIGPIRAITFYAYIDTPHRFQRKSALFRYCGIGLERRHSGSGPVRVRLSRNGNRYLKNALVGAARSAAAGDNPYADKYQHWTQEEGLHTSTARRNVARSLASTMWSLWKTGGKYDPAKA